MDQRLEDVEFQRSEIDQSASAPDFASVKVDLNISKYLGRIAGMLQPPCASEHGVNSRKQFMRIKRLWEVIIRSCIQAKNSIVSMRFRRKHDYGHLFALTQLLQDGYTADDWQHYIENDQVVFTVERTRQTIATIVRTIQLIAHLREEFPHHSA